MDKKKVGNGIMAMEGIKVLEMSIGQVGPVGGAMLGDLGAEVVKIEEPKSGDWGRYFQILGTKEPKSPYAYWENNNRNKRSLAIDLKKEGARDVIYRLAKNCDVFLTNYRPVALEKLGMDYPSLSAHNPGIIYARATGYGTKGPDAGLRVTDLAAQARGGIMTITSGSNGSPGRIGSGMADQLGGIFLAYGTLAALLARERTGVGQEVDTSMLASQMALGSVMLQLFLFRGDLSLSPNVMAAQDRECANNPLFNYYQCKDDRWICISMPATDPVWPDFCRVLEIQDLEKDPRFDTHENRTAVNGRELIAVLDRIFATRSSAEWEKILRELIIPVAVVKNYAEVASDPQVIANNYIVDFEHPTAGDVKYVGLPVQLSKTPGRIRRPAPELGQHTEEILQSLGSYSWEEITGLKDKGII
jgi:crotonobetainyl-CoA:carnitine CoA-transferase CaiB-like acyl-CoA transferase